MPINPQDFDTAILFINAAQEQLELDNTLASLVRLNKARALLTTIAEKLIDLS
jgi:hypothetical protein